MTYKTNNDILRVKYGCDYDLLLRATYTPVTESIREAYGRLLEPEKMNPVVKFLSKVIIFILGLIPNRQRLNITYFGPITMATR